MHHIIAKRMNLDLSKGIDHINCNKLDNRRENLRVATRSQNMFNRTAQRNNRSGLKGVTKRKGKWTARIQKDGIQYDLGLFNTPEEASTAYTEAAEQLHGEFANEEIFKRQN